MTSRTPSSPENLLDQVKYLESVICDLDAIYSRLTLVFKQVTPILRKRVFDPTDQQDLKVQLGKARHDLETFSQLIRRGEGERALIHGEIIRCKLAHSGDSEGLATLEAAVWELTHELTVREKGLGCLNDLVQLLEGVMSLGEMTEFDEKLLTEIVTDLKNLAVR